MGRTAEERSDFEDGSHVCGMFWDLVMDVVR
jgi:hypothetical protein